ncbi:DUF1672 family protein [Listeria fleischmannii]|uniref:DUF1672 family protein n=1 Tax=Listeria fleischmannii TaxID=1069827 RepID=A0A841YHR9_9LIST|nr:DUF1672 family protein [Listeria fleischmannii]MBC1399760.1 DUF1672 family protein [Listeria fleischmannii]MBC1428085.1 DUF1672 family protein [Listeria fleischmannii]
MNGKKIAISIISLSILLGGCSFMGNSDEKEKKADDGTTPVAEYKGQGFRLVDGDKSKDIVEKNEAEIKKRAITYMKDTYKTNVKVNNVVPARDAAVVKVEAEKPIKFHTSVIVGLDMKKKELYPAGSVHSQEGEVEGAIISGLYVKAYQKEFERLDSFVEKEAKKYNLQGLNQTTIDKTQSSGYEQSYYFVPTGGEFKTVYETYLKNPTVSSTELRELFAKETDKMYIAIHYFNISDGLPKQKIADEIGKDLVKENGLPKGTYSTSIFKNFIVNRVGQPDGENIETGDIQK